METRCTAPIPGGYYPCPEHQRVNNSLVHERCAAGAPKFCETCGAAAAVNCDVARHVDALREEIAGMSVLPCLPAVETLTVKPGDRLVLRYPGKLSGHAMDNLRLEIDRLALPGLKPVLVLQEGAQLAVLTENNQPQDLA